MNAFLGSSPNVRVVLSKPDKMGLWIYELCVILENGLPYMIDLRLHNAISSLGESIPVNTIIKRWGNIIKDFNAQCLADTILFVDAYYLDEAGRKYLCNSNLKYMASLNQKRFPVICDQVKRGVEARGQWNALWNRENNEIVVHAFDKNGKKYTTMSNAYSKVERKSKTGVVPVSADYKKYFNACDKFNKQIKHRIWPHKHGGRNSLGENGKHSSFVLGAIIQNTFNAHRSIRNVCQNDFEYYTYCNELADHLYMYANTLPCSCVL